ncbi:MAG: helix-turn-helix transcriptional regulator [Thermoleophilaceae bacterium]
MAVEDENQQRVGANIKAAREALDWSQEAAAAEAGMHPTALSMIETGARAPKLDTLIRLAFALSVEPGTFFSGVKRPEGARPRHGAD